MKELSVCSRVQLSVRGSHIIKAKMVLSKMQLQACFRFCCSKCDYGNQLHLSFNGFVSVFLFYIYSRRVCLCINYGICDYGNQFHFSFNGWFVYFSFTYISKF